MRKIYTRTGDKGTTGIHGGARVCKEDIRIEANGCVDELNAQIGLVRTLLSPDDEWQQWLYGIQCELMVVMSHVATPSALRDANPNPLPKGMAERCEGYMDHLMEQMQDNGFFVLPGGTPLSAQLHYARTVARRAERRLWALHRQDELPEEILCGVNRLSDLFFVMARYELQRAEIPEERWKSFAYKRKKQE